MLVPEDPKRGAHLSEFPLQRESDGYFSEVSRHATPGMGYRFRYRFRAAATVPDPASRFQPNGPHGASRIEGPARFAWRDGAWTGVTLQDAVL